MFARPSCIKITARSAPAPGSDNLTAGEKSKFFNDGDLA